MKIQAPDLVGYESLTTFIEKHSLFNLDGDILEIGSFLGGGTIKLAELALKYNKKVVTIDIFKPEFDNTVNLDGLAMSEIYNWILQGKKQRDIFNKIIEGYENIEVIDKDSKELSFPKDKKFFFTFIDGNHSPDYVKNDFKLVWNNTVPGGAVGFHDYGGDLPQTTGAIDEIIKEYKKEIEKSEQIKEKSILFLFKIKTEK